VARQRVLITGATSGFGAGVALQLARARFDVTAAGETWQQVTSLREIAAEQKAKLDVIKLDLLEQSDIADQCARPPRPGAAADPRDDEAQARQGHLDVVSSRPSGRAILGHILSHQARDRSDR